MHAVILGCGYIGLEAGRRLTEVGHRVTGMRRSAAGIESIESAGFEAIRGDITDSSSLEGLPDADWLLYTASAGRGGEQTVRDIYIEGLQLAIEEYAAREASPDRIVYTSSTGVYGDHGGEWVDEETPPAPIGQRGRVLLEAESLALDEASSRGIDGTVVRFGGLYGPDRYRIERYLDQPVTGGYRNSTHRNDGAGAMVHLLETDQGRDEVILVVDDEPVDKWEFADWLATQCDRDPPPKVTVEERLATDDLSTTAAARLKSDKRCRNDRLHNLGYELEVPTVWEGYQPAIAEYKQHD